MLKSEVIGNIGSDAIVKQINGRDYVSFSVAHQRSKEETVWISVLWYGNGGNLLQYLTSGKQVFVRGDMVVKTYTGRNNELRVSLNLNANEVQLVGNRQESQSRSAQEAVHQQPPYQAQPSTPVAPDPNRLDPQQDDLPF